MRYLEFREKIKRNIFTFLDVVKYFSYEKPQTVKVQLSRFVKKGLIKKIKRGFYCFDKKGVDEFLLANLLYHPSYISLETALNFYGIIPDVPQTVTSVTLVTTKRITTSFGNFSYNKIKPQLFFGFDKIKSPTGGAFFDIAKKEKALLDYFYERKIDRIEDLRFNLESLDRNFYRQYAENYPRWVKRIRL